jgi:uncharacterized protein YdeI (YjbR/CyaY-like superfamily)
MIAAGLMTPAGSALIRPGLLRRRPPAPKTTPRSGDVIPDFIRQGLAGDARARAFFKSLAPSYRRLYIRWVTAAKKQETRQRRLIEMLATLRSGRKLGMK